MWQDVRRHSLDVVRLHIGAALNDGECSGRAKQCERGTWACTELQTVVLSRRPHQLNDVTAHHRFDMGTGNESDRLEEIFGANHWHEVIQRACALEAKQ